MKRKKDGDAQSGSYSSIHGDIVVLLESARRTAARSLNALMTATYWEIGRRIVEFEQGGKERAAYGESLIRRLAEDLSRQFGRGFGRRNLWQMRAFHLTWPADHIVQTLSAQSANPGIVQTLSGQFEPSPIHQTLSDKFRNSLISQIASAEADAPRIGLPTLAQAFPLPWSAYVNLLSVENLQARSFYETEALRNGWSVRQLGRQISSQFYERTALSLNKAAILKKGADIEAGDSMTPEQALRDPFVLEFLDLKDEYSESELEAGLIQHLADFLLELGDDFAFVGRQRGLRLDDNWFRVDLLFFHRRLKCLLIIDLKAGRFGHADAGQMHMYLNYAREHWAKPGENPPVGLILCAGKGLSEARYALDGLSNKVLAAEYRTVLPDEKLLIEELNKTRQEYEARQIGRALGKRARK